MSTDTMNNTFDPQILADDFLEVRRIYAEYIDTLDETSWDKPVKGGSKEWTLHEAIVHLCALNGAGLESIQNTLRGETYSFAGLENRYVFNAYNRTGIDEHLDIPIQELRAILLGIFDEAASIACSLQPSQAEQTAQLPIYNNYKKYRCMALEAWSEEDYETRNDFQVSVRRHAPNAAPFYTRNVMYSFMLGCEFSRLLRSTWLRVSRR